MRTLHIPNLQKLGLLNLHPAGDMKGVEKPLGKYLRLAEVSNGKDTMTGHWEMMGIKTEKPFKTFTANGFPPELIAELEKRCGVTLEIKLPAARRLLKNWEKKR